MLASLLESLSTSSRYRRQRPEGKSCCPMLFNSYSFLFGFLPVALIGYQVAAHWHRRAVVAWLALISLVFYGYWRPAFLFVLCGSIALNYVAGALITRTIPNQVSTRLLLWGAVALNLATLCYFKYLIPSLNRIAVIVHSGRHWSDLVLPLGISFFTFTQIAYLIDLEAGSARQQELESYVLFVTFFPHLIAGPILHHAEIMPQFQRERDFRLRADDLAVGFTWFVMGLFKKVILADRFATDADAAFAFPHDLHAVASWMGVFAYSLQLYFDFSGYTDMAMGLARMFSIDFPLNFSSPYKAVSIIEFWQRWHMTLTRYINVYLYNPTSVWINRRRLRQGKKVSRKATATMGGFAQLVALPTTLTLFLAGIWHGAGLQFIIFGLLHAGYLSANHAWRVWRGVRSKSQDRHPVHAAAATVCGVLLTYSAVLLAQIFFRASSTRAALSLLGGMLGHHHAATPRWVTLHADGGLATRLLLGYFVVWALPNTQQILARFKPSLQLAPPDLQPSLVRFAWQPTVAWSFAAGSIFLFTLIKMQNPSTFLYFQF